MHVIICVNCWPCYGTLSNRFAVSCRHSIKCTRLVPDIGHNPFEVEGILQYTGLISLPKTPATHQQASNVSQYLTSTSLRHWDCARPAAGSHSQVGIPQFEQQ